MKTYSDLTEATERFFSRHWNASELSRESPRWERWREFLFASVPNYDKAGCYALFAGPELVYVGLGASKGGGTYPNCGLSRRLMAHVICADKPRGDQWSKLRDEWANVTDLYTLGFDRDLAYVAAALETFLIRELAPPRNARV